ncbi:MAG: hypothetical protein ACI837_000860 [Crocinitomicaceae bacterium]|jgi:hypothetical protein
MEKKNTNILKKGLLKTESDFTSKLMDQLDAEDKALASLLTKQGALETSPDFTAQLMTELEGKRPKVPYTPVITLRGWIAAAAVFAGIIILTLFIGTTGPSEFVENDKIEAFKSGIGEFFKERSLFIYLLLGALLLSVGLFLEQRSNRTNETQA